MHTIKGTCGFLGLPRLEALTHAAETLMGNFRDGKPVTGEAVSLVLATIDRVKMLLDELERDRDGAGGRRSGPDRASLQRMAGGAGGPPAAERPLRPKQISLAELERALRRRARRG